MLMASQPDHTLLATAPYYCQHYNQQHGLKLVTRPIPFDNAQLQKMAVPFTLMWHKRNGHNPNIIWLKSMIKQLYGEAFQSGFLSG